MAQPDLSEFHRLSAPRKKPCMIGLILRGDITPKLSEDDMAKLRAALDTDRGIITGSAVVAWLKERGHSVNTNQVGCHRRGVCSCDRPE